jgi:hypothetical protein
MSSFSIECECGSKVEVSASDAGRSLDCNCGRLVIVPRLSELRKLSGRDPFEAGVLDTVKRELRECNNIVGRFCLHSGKPTENIVWVDLACETRHVVAARDSARDWGPVQLIGALMTVFLLPFGVFVYIFSRIWKDNAASTGPREVGHDRAILLPLPISAEFEKKLSNRKLLRYAKQVPLYQKIFAEYPDASLTKNS